ncbi:UNKNOWN [Stylonychia lemnae]|uniref:Uncharacterized protein n=1 Tax=Stylonychia lemnae TaxID=5949 RepID=A0A078B259_STYLE|nr:UNKNOWN [Stylonychia lemnae]|eukprot:CDW88574.1 UNKNOWN [Stylonychia lemnae]
MSKVLDIVIDEEEQQYKAKYVPKKYDKSKKFKKKAAVAKKAMLQKTLGGEVQDENGEVIKEPKLLQYKIRQSTFDILQQYQCGFSSQINGGASLNNDGIEDQVTEMNTEQIINQTQQTQEITDTQTQKQEDSEMNDESQNNDENTGDDSAEEEEAKA